MKKVLLVFGIIFVIAGIVYSVMIWREAERPKEGLLQGKPLLSRKLFAFAEKTYARQCAVCHGASGKGDGPASYLLFPKPRDFTKGDFRFISTKNLKPTDEDLYSVISKGLPGSAMPAWDHLSERERWGLVYYVRYFIGIGETVRKGELSEEAVAKGLDWERVQRFASAAIDPGALIQIPEESPASDESLQKGKEVFKIACASCHGPEGRGDGPQVMVDSMGFPTRPRDLTSGVFKGGPESANLYKRLVAGLPGSPMPSYQGALTDEQIWDVIHFVQTLPGKEKPLAAGLQQLKLSAAKIAGEIPRTPEAGEWKGVRSVTIPLAPLWWRDQRVEEVQVRALHNGRKIAFYLSWKDENPDQSAGKPQLFPDGAALQFSLEKDPPFFGMGDAAGVVRFWHWKASWQEEMKGERNLEQNYPHAAVDWYEADKSYKHGSRFEVSQSKTESQEPLFMGGWGAGNPLSQGARKSAMEEAAAKGLGTMTSRLQPDPRGKAEGFWKEGRWHLIFERGMAAAGLDDFGFSSGAELNVAFAVWDGAAGDRNGQKNVSVWNELTVEK